MALGMAAAALHVQRALVARVEAQLSDEATGAAAMVRAYAVPWPADVDYPTRLYDEPPPDTLPCYRLGALSVDEEGSGASRVYELSQTLEVLASPVMGRPTVLALAAALEQATLAQDTPEITRWPQETLAVSSVDGTITSTRLHIVDTRTDGLRIVLSELGGVLVYIAQMELRLSMWEPENAA